jgi:hypothetical protein
MATNAFIQKQFSTFKALWESIYKKGRNLLVICPARFSELLKVAGNMYGSQLSMIA